MRGNKRARSKQHEHARLDRKERTALSFRTIHLHQHHRQLVLPYLRVGRSKVAGHMQPGPSTVLTVSQIILYVLSVVGPTRVSVGVRRKVVTGVVTWVTNLGSAHMPSKGFVIIALKLRLRLLVLQFR